MNLFFLVGKLDLDVCVCVYVYRFDIIVTCHKFEDCLYHLSFSLLVCPKLFMSGDFKQALVYPFPLFCGLLVFGCKLCRRCDYP